MTGGCRIGVELGLKAKPKLRTNGGLQMGVMKGSKIKEHVCPACNGTGYPVVKQPVQPGHKIYPLKCKSCDGNREYFLNKPQSIGGRTLIVRDSRELSKMPAVALQCVPLEW